MPDRPNDPDAYEQVLIESRDEWASWLSTNHQRSPGIWLARWKKASGRPMVRYDDVVEEALAFGWVDSRPRSLNEAQSLLVTPRKPKSNWSRLNKERAEALIRSGQMAPAGHTAVEVAKANGAWDALNQVEALTEPPDLAGVLDVCWRSTKVAFCDQRDSRWWGLRFFPFGTLAGPPFRWVCCGGGEGLMLA